MPHVDTPEMAARMVANCRYPPQGHRSVTGALPQLDFATHPMAEWTAAINDATLLILMIESPQAVENIDAIAAVPGFDVLLVGTNDLCTEMGIAGQLEHPQVVAAFERIIAACRTNGKYAGLGGVYHPPLMERYLAMGFRLVLAGSDLSLMLAAAKERAAMVAPCRAPEHRIVAPAPAIIVEPMRIAFDVVGLDVVLTTVLPFVRRGYWWVRIWDFPRVQIAAIEALVLAALLLMGPFGGVQGPIIAALALAVGYQAYRIWPFTPLARSRSCRAYARSPIESCASWSPMCWCRTGRAPS